MLGYDPSHQRAVQQAWVEKTSSWLKVLQLAKNHFDLYMYSGVLRWTYIWIQENLCYICLPAKCDGCGSPCFNLEHVSDYRKDGIVTQRHDETICLSALYVGF